MTGAFFTVALLRPRAKHWRPRAARCPGAAAQPLPRRRRGLQALSTWRPALCITLTRPRARLSRAAFTPLAARKAARASQARRGPGDRGLRGRGPVSWDVEPAAPAAARFQLRCLRSPQLVRAVSRSFSGVSEEVCCFVTATAPSQGHAVCSHQLYPAGGLPGPSRGTVGASRTALCTALGSAGQCGACLGACGGPGSQRLSPPRAKPAPEVTP